MRRAVMIWIAFLVWLRAPRPLPFAVFWILLAYEELVHEPAKRQLGRLLHRECGRNDAPPHPGPLSKGERENRLALFRKGRIDWAKVWHWRNWSGRVTPDSRAGRGSHRDRGHPPSRLASVRSMTIRGGGWSLSGLVWLFQQRGFRG